MARLKKLLLVVASAFGLLLIGHLYIGRSVLVSSNGASFSMSAAFRTRQGAAGISPSSVSYLSSKLTKLPQPLPDPALSSDDDDSVVITPITVETTKLRLDPTASSTVSSTMSSSSSSATRLAAVGDRAESSQEYSFAYAGGEVQDVRRDKKRRKSGTRQKKYDLTLRAVVKNKVVNFEPPNLHPILLSGGDKRVVGQSKSVANFRPYPAMIDPMNYALEMARMRLHLEVYGVNGLRNMQNGGNGSQAAPKLPSSLLRPISGKGKWPPLNLPNKHIVIYTYWRSGSTFLGDLLNHYPGTYYHFEPLHHLSQNYVVNNTKDMDRSLRLVSNLLSCKYNETGMSDYIQWVSEAEHQFLFRHNTRFWNSCRMRSSLCYSPKFLSALCREHPVQLVKLVRMPLVASSAKEMLLGDPKLKIIYLTRDPRGTMSSRLSLDWCNQTKSCIDPAELCKDMTKDLQAAAQLQEEFPKRFILLRYEDLSVEPEQRTEELFAFLELDVNKHVSAFLKTHTKLMGPNDSVGGPYSTRRNSRKTPFRWRKKLKYSKIQSIQDTCSEVMRALDYKPITSVDELNSQETDASSVP